VSYRQTKNMFKVPRKTWERWSQRSRYIYNRSYSMARDQGTLISAGSHAQNAVFANEEYERDNRRFP
jgi:hypothetical protein